MISIEEEGGNRDRNILDTVKKETTHALYSAVRAPQES